MAPRYTDEWRDAVRIAITSGYGEPSNMKKSTTCTPIRHLEHEWRRWCAKEEIEPKHPTKHYVTFCESWFAKRGHP